MEMFLGRYSWNELKDSFVAGCHRFPIVLLFLLIATINAIVLNHENNAFSGRTEFLMIFYPLSAAILSLALQLWSEEVRNKMVSISVQVIAHVLLLGSSIWLTSTWPLDIVQGTALFTIVAVLILAVFMVSFFRSKTDLPLWNFTMHLLRGLALAFVVGIVLIAGLRLLIYSFMELFGWNINWRILSDIYFVCGILITPTVFLQFIPGKEKKHDENAQGLSKVMQGVVHFLFVPLLCAYILTLYAYAGKILLTWTLPCGWVSWLVSTMMLGMVTILILTYPSQFHEEKRFDHLLMRWLPIVALPLLVLMTIGIYRRISDYGITVMRLYLITFNLWCYAVCFYLIWKKGRRMNWIPASFGIVLFLVSVGPQSFANITLHQMKSDLKQIVSASNSKSNLAIPFTNKDMMNWIEKQDSLTQQQVKDKLHYLGTTYELARLADVIDTASFKGVSFYTLPHSGEIVESLNGYSLLDRVIDIPAGCTRMWNVDESHKILSDDDKTIVIEIHLSNEKAIPFTLSKERMRDINKSKNPTKPWIIENEEGYLYVKSFYYYGSQPVEMNLAGLLFEKTKTK